jgi:hypothetical protein
MITLTKVLRFISQHRVTLSLCEVFLELSVENLKQIFAAFNLSFKLPYRPDLLHN